MSWFTMKPVSCPRCATQFNGHSAETVNVTRMPEARERILAGSFHTEECPECGLKVTLDRQFMFTDMERFQFVMVFPRPREAQWVDLEGIAEATFWGGFENAPPGMQAYAQRFRIRTVFGMAALAEKLRIWEGGLDDAVVELLKMELATSMNLLRAQPNLELLLLDIAEDDDRLEFLVRDRDAGPDDVLDLVAARLSRYRELTAERPTLEAQWPELFRQAFVHWRRLAVEPGRALPTEPTELIEPIEPGGMEAQDD